MAAASVLIVRNNIVNANGRKFGLGHLKILCILTMTQARNLSNGNF